MLGQLFHFILFRLIKEAVLCAWKHAEGCEDTEEYFKDILSELKEEYECGITVGGTTPAPPKPTGNNTPVSGQTNCIMFCKLTYGIIVGGSTSAPPKPTGRPTIKIKYTVVCLVDPTYFIDHNFCCNFVDLNIVY